jgi:hypothetical protein
MRNITTTGATRLFGAPAGTCSFCRLPATHWAPVTGARWASRDRCDYAESCAVCEYKQCRKRQQARNKANSERRAGSEAYAAGMARQIRAHAKSVSPEASLEDLASRQREIEAQIEATVRHLRSEAGGGLSWTEIGTLLGITKTSAMRRYGSAETDARQAGGQPGKYR